MEWIVPIVVLTGLAAPLVERLLRGRTGLVLALVPFGVTLHALMAQSAISAGQIGAFSLPWVPSLGLRWAFRVDGLSNLFVLLIAGIGTLIVVYSAGYLRGHPRLGRFYAFLFVFMGAMLGVATADDVFLLFVFWELTTISSFLLIGFESERAAARSAAVQSLIVTAAGGLALLAGLVLLVSAAGTTSISALGERGELLRAHAHYPWALALVSLGAFTKSAQVPFHFWLPAAMQAPTPVSAYLHSSTMVKAGVFVLARFSPALGGTDLWTGVLGCIGTLSMLSGALLALGQDDLKRILAYSTISVLGLLTLLLAIGTPIAARAFAVTLFAHALYKGTLFLVTGSVDHATGTRSLQRLGGLRSAMPWTACAALVAGISMAGAPPLFGFLAKETAYEAVLEAPRYAWIFAPAAVLTAVCLVFSALRAGLQAFSGERPHFERAPHDPPAVMVTGPLLLAAAGLLAGAIIGPAERWIVAPAASAILQEQAPTGLALWHGFTPILALSALTVLLGLGLFRGRSRLLAIAARSAAAFPWSTGSGFARAGGGLLDFAKWQARLLQNGSLHRYLWVTLATAFAATLWAMAGTGVLPSLVGGPSPSLMGLAAILLVLGGSVLMFFAPTPLGSVAALGAVGFGVSLIFLVYSAPDLAVTQLVVEVLTVVLFVFVLPRLPRPGPGRRHTLATIALASIGGVTMGALTLLAFQVQLVEPISSFFNEQALPLAHGRNVVNVILVDFRALDTLGEITVLAVAALGCLALLGRRASGSAS